MNEVIEEKDITKVDTWLLDLQNPFVGALKISTAMPRFGRTYGPKTIKSVVVGRVY